MRRRAAALLRMADGDGRAVLTLAEEMWRAAKPGEVFDAAALQAIVQRRAPIYDKGAGGPLQSDLGAAQIGARLRSRCGAVLSRPHARCRRGSALSRRAGWCAWRSRISAWPTRRRWCIANAAKDAYDYLGSPEGELAFAQACVYLATAPKSNAVYTAFKAATRGGQGERLADAAQAHPERPDQAYEGEGYGAGYRYDHDAPDAFSGQDYFPEKMGRADLLRSAGPRLRARDPQTAGLLGEAAR